MKATLVSLCATEQATQAGRPSLTPELLAASGARYSRNNEGLEAILSKIDPENLDKSVDGLFRMVDYGHQSIADMAPVAIFMDGVSLWLAYLLWSWSPTAGGQESSTRYIKMDSALHPEEVAGAEWDAHLSRCFAAYQTALDFWTEVGEREPARTRIPAPLLEDTSDKAKKQVARMKRNYAFDRARMFLPVGSTTNVMLVMSARGWVNLCQRLLSYPLAECRRLGDLIRGELALVTPRLLKHAVAKESFQKGFADKFLPTKTEAPATLTGAGFTDDAGNAFLRDAFACGVYAPEALKHHDNRYAYIGSELEMMAVEFGWTGITFGEVRDLNRHRTGSKALGRLPTGFYWAEDEAPESGPGPLAELKEVGREASRKAFEELRGGNPAGVYWSLLGTQFSFTHVTTADKFIYEAELRTGTGAHYRYAKHMRDALALWYESFPETKGLVLEGSAEPE